jgi:hypothetical protein
MCRNQHLYTPWTCRARLLSVNKQLWSFSCTHDGFWRELMLAARGADAARSMAAFLQRRRHLVSSLGLSLSRLRQEDPLLPQSLATAAVATLAGGPVTRLTMDLCGSQLRLEAPWLAGLAGLEALTVFAHASVDPSFSSLTSLSSLRLFDCAPGGMLGAYLPASLRSLAFSFAAVDDDDYAGNGAGEAAVGDGEQRSLPAAVAALPGLEELTIESMLEDVEGLQQLAGSLTSLALASPGVPRQVAALSRLRSLTVMVDVVHGDQLEVLAQLTQLTSFTLTETEEGEGGMILAPLPAALLGLPMMEVGPLGLAFCDVFLKTRLAAAMGSKQQSGSVFNSET